MNPKLPPRDKACIHQLNNGQMVAECPEHCEDEYRVSGYNIRCTWDKNTCSNEGSYVHITRPLDFLIKKLKVAQERVFENTERNGDKEWFTRDDTCVFLNSKGNSFGSLDMSRVSEIIGVDVTAYTWR